MHKYKEDTNIYAHIHVHTDRTIYLHINLCIYKTLLLIILLWNLKLCIFGAMLSVSILEMKTILKAPITSIPISLALKWKGIFINISCQNLIFSYSYFHRIKKLYALVCMLVPHKQLPPQNTVTGISLLDISSKTLSQFYLNFFLVGLENLVSAISVQCSILAYCVSSPLLIPEFS